MASALSFQIIAQAPSLDPAFLQQLQKSLCEAFDLDPVFVGTHLQHGGVQVMQTSTLEEANAQAQQLRAMGADFCIIDGKGSVVLEGHATPLLDPNQGFDSAELAASYTPLTVEEKTKEYDVPPSQILMRGVGAASPMRKRRPPTAPFGGKPTANPACASSAFAGLESGELVLLDGTVEHEEASASFPLGLDHPLSPESFAPPEEEEELELVEIQPRATLRPVPQAPPLADHDEPALTTSPRNSAAYRALEPPQAPALSPVHQPIPQPLASSRETIRNLRPIQAASAPASRKVYGRFFLGQQREGWRLFGGWFDERPRLRILIGFFLALGLASIIPTCHAHSIITTQITPQLEDLSTAQAHGQILAQLPNYRSPEEIQDTIERIKLRNRIYDFIIWLSSAGLIGFLWFRFS